MNLDRIKRDIVITDTGCWEWQKSCNSAGYGQLKENKVHWLAHRYVYACLNTLEKGYVIRHKCHNRKCCNPEHLETGTHKDNWHDSKETHLKASVKQRKVWTVCGVKYDTIREASEHTKLCQTSLIKYTVDGIFDIIRYRNGCKKANVTPRV